MKRATAPVLIALTLAGCSSPLRDGGFDSWVDADPEAWSAPGSPAEHRLGDLRPEDADGSVPADVEQLVALALRRNPALAAAQRRVERLRARRPQVESLEDPMLTLAPVGDMAQTAAGEVGFMAGLSQKFPFPGKLEARGDAADRAAEAAEADLADRRLQVAAAVRRAWWSLAYARQAVGVVNEDVQLRERLRDSAAARYRAGSAERADVLRAQVEVDALFQDLLELRQQGETATASLNRLLDRATDTQLPDPPEATLEDSSGTLDELLVAAADHPRLASLRQQIAASRDRIRLANLERYPDLTVGVQFAGVDDEGVAPAATGDDQLFLTLGINLPLWQERRDGAEAEALAGLGEAAAMFTDEQNRLAFAVTDALARVAQRREAVALYDADMVPAAEEAVASAAAGYRSGQVDFIALIDNARRLTTLKLMRLRAITRLQQDLADLREAVGTPDTPSPTPNP